MSRAQTHTVEGYSYLEKPTLLGAFSEYISSQFVWPDALKWKGSVILPTLPGVLAMTGLSSLVCVAHINFHISISVPVSVLGTVSVALGLLLAFRVNTAYDRYWEGRKLVQTVMATIRNLTRQIWINIPEKNEADHLEKMRCVKLLLAFFVATKHHLRREFGIKYYDLEVLLPPNWMPASEIRRKKLLAKQKANMKSTALNIKIDSDGNGEPTVKDKLKKKDFHIMKKAPALLVTLTDSFNSQQEASYMDSDDPTHISNIRRSLISQEFPNSELSQVSAAQLRGTLTGANLERTLSDEEQQTPRLLDESVNSPPMHAVPDSPRTSQIETSLNNDSQEGSSQLKRKGTLEERFSKLKERFHIQQHNGHRRHLDHSEFTSEEDLPYQGDSDLSLPLEILFRVALFINQAKAAGKIESPLVSATTSSLDILINSLTAFERIVHTPIPKAYNIHLKQAVILYIFFLPFALVESVGWLVAPIVAIVSFTLFGIEAIGAEIENPFGYDDNDLPLNRYCDELKKEVEYIIYHIPTQSTSILLDGQ